MTLYIYCCRLGEARRSHFSANYDKSKLVDQKVPFYACFIFRYRSKDLLRAEGIMPLHEVPAISDQTQATAGYKRTYPSRPDVAEAVPSPKRAKIAMPTAPSTLKADARPSAAQLTEDGDVVALQNELDAVQRRAQALQSKIQTIHGSRPSQRVKTDQGALEEDTIHLTHGAIKRECSPIRLVTCGSVIDLTLEDD